MGAYLVHSLFLAMYTHIKTNITLAQGTQAEMADGTFTIRHHWKM